MCIFYLDIRFKFGSPDSIQNQLNILAQLIHVIQRLLMFRFLMKNQNQ